MPSPYGFSRLLRSASFLVCVALCASFVAPRQMAADPARGALWSNDFVAAADQFAGDKSVAGLRVERV